MKTLHAPFRIVLAQLAALAGLIGFAAHQARAQSLTITHASVVDVEKGLVVPNATIVIEGNRIARVTAPVAGATRGRVIDVGGAYVIPGLWDMHTHAYFGWTREFGDSYVLPMFVANGITGIRDMGSDLDAVLNARRAVAEHKLVGPRMVVSGPMLDGPTVAFAASMPIKTAEDGRRAVDSLERRGVDFIKVQSGVPRDGYFALADEAKKRGIAFEGHVPDAIRASEAIGAGQRTFEHLIGIFEASTPDEDQLIHRKYGAGKQPAINKSLALFLDRYDPAREKALIQVLAQKQIWQCPTLFWERGQWLVDTLQYRLDPDSAYTPKSWLAKKYPVMQKSIVGSMDADPLDVRARFVAHELEIVHRLHAAGVPLLAGTDTPAGVDVAPGISLHLELQRFVAAGLTPLEALKTATLNPARFYGKTTDYGTVQAGRIADLVILARNPLDDIKNTRTIVGVVTDGQYWSPAGLDSLKTKLRAVATMY